MRSVSGGGFAPVVIGAAVALTAGMALTSAPRADGDPAASPRFERAFYLCLGTESAEAGHLYQPWRTEPAAFGIHFALRYSRTLSFVAAGGLGIGAELDRRAFLGARGTLYFSLWDRAAKPPPPGGHATGDLSGGTGFAGWQLYAGYAVSDHIDLLATVLRLSPDWEWGPDDPTRVEVGLRWRD